MESCALLCAFWNLLWGCACLFWDLHINAGAFGIIAVKMLNNILLLSVLTVTSFPSKTDSRKTSKDICKNRCSCEEKENALNINCENKGFTTVSHLQPPQNKISQLFLNGNFLTKISPNEFLNYGNVTSLHLGNNGLQEIKTGAFNGLKNLKRLHLNNNNLEIIREDTFSGLESLEYLQADYNYISAIETGAFNKLNKLKVLILNDNLLLSLPNNIFRFVMLTHLDLRGKPTEDAAVCWRSRTYRWNNGDSAGREPVELHLWSDTPESLAGYNFSLCGGYRLWDAIQTAR